MISFLLLAAALAQASPIQAMVDRAQPGDHVVVEAGTYEGDLVIDRAITLVGHGRPTLVGSGVESVVRIRAAGVTIEGFDIDGRAGGDLGRDSSGIHVAAARVTIRDCHIRQSLFGIYLRESDDAVVENSTVTGIPGREPGENGSGIHVWNSQRFHLTGNRITRARRDVHPVVLSRIRARQPGERVALRSPLHVFG